MRNFIVFIVVFSSINVYATTNIDTLLLRVAQKYNEMKSLSYEVNIKKWDSSKKILLNESRMLYQYAKPHFHIHLLRQKEQMYIDNYYIEVNHLDSLIMIKQNPRLDSQTNVMSLYNYQVNEWKLKPKVEFEDENKIKVVFDLPEEINGFYMSMVIDKKKMIVTQNQISKRELIRGEMKLFFYEMNMSNVEVNSLNKIRDRTIIDILSQKIKQQETKFNNYKIEFKN